MLAVWASSGACWATRLSPSSRSTRPPSLSRTRPRSPFSIVADEGTCGTRLSGSSVRAQGLHLLQAGTQTAATAKKCEAPARLTVPSLCRYYTALAKALTDEFGSAVRG